MRNKTNKKFRKTKKTRKNIKTRKNRRLKNNYKKTQKKGGVKGLKSALLAASSIGLLGAAKTQTDNYIMAVCAGNTCRSTMAQEALISILGNTDYEIFSRGVTVGERLGKPMAPLSEAVSIETCKGDQECITRVKAHESTQFDCNEVLKILRANLKATIEIIPMDDTVADKIKMLMDVCELSPQEKSRIKIGFCDEKSAKIPDPFFDKGTPREGQAYADAGNRIFRSFYEAYGTECKLDIPHWIDATSKFGTPMVNDQNNIWPGYVPNENQDIYYK
jgi:protein-tyrosine-phosphatase